MLTRPTLQRLGASRSLSARPAPSLRHVAGQRFRHGWPSQPSQAQACGPLGLALGLACRLPVRQGDATSRHRPRPLPRPSSPNTENGKDQIQPGPSARLSIAWGNRRAPGSSPIKC